MPRRGEADVWEGGEPGGAEEERDEGECWLEEDGGGEAFVGCRLILAVAGAAGLEEDKGFPVLGGADGTVFGAGDWLRFDTRDGLLAPTSLLFPRLILLLSRP
jgi:hypothetical protein